MESCVRWAGGTSDVAAKFEDGVCGLKNEQWSHGRQGGKRREHGFPSLWRAS